MSVSYDLFTGAFLSKITEFEFINLPDEDKASIVDEYMKRASVKSVNLSHTIICGTLCSVDKKHKYFLT